MQYHIFSITYMQSPLGYACRSKGKFELSN
jgi:hypothetical protein